MGDGNAAIVVHSRRNFTCITAAATPAATAALSTAAASITSSFNK
jgi:hypothetical protein